MSRRYERGENRFKHVGKMEVPVIETVANEVVGKCPCGKTPEWRQGLLDRAVGYMVDDPYSPEFPKRLYTVDTDGTIYVGETTNLGESYHGYPYSGTLGRRLTEALRVIAVEKGCEKEFKRWLKLWTTPAGRPDI